MMNFQLPKPPFCLRLANWLRILQFLAKAIMAWYIIIKSHSSLFETFHTAQWVLGLIGFGVVYMIWRFYSLFIRVNQYHLQWSFALFDITATTLVKTVILSLSLYFINGDLKTLNYTLAGITCVYYILPALIFIYTFYAICKVKSATSKMGGPFGDVMNTMTGTMGIQTFSLQGGCFKILVYLNVLVATCLAIFGVIVNLMFLSKYSAFDSVFGALVLFELIDILLNFIEDRIVVHYAKENVGSFMPEPPFPPFTCCGCGAFPQMSAGVNMGGGMQEPLMVM